MSEAMKELDLSHALLVTRHEEFSIEDNTRTIEVIPLWRFLIQEEPAS